MARPHKGDRYPRTIRFPQTLNTQIEDAAEAAGYTDGVSDFVVEVVSRAYAAGLWPEAADDQQRLPIGA